MNKKLTEEEIANVLKQFGSKVQTLRVQKTMSIVVLAEKCGLTEEQLTMTENGTWLDLDVISMFRLAEALDTQLHLMVKGV